MEEEGIIGVRSCRRIKKSIPICWAKKKIGLRRIVGVEVIEGQGHEEERVIL